MSTKNVIPAAAAPLTKPGDGITGLFQCGIVWDGVNHRDYITLPMQFNQVSGSQTKFTVMTDIDVRSGDEFWKLVDALGQDHIDLTKKFKKRLDEINIDMDTGYQSDLRAFYSLGPLLRLDTMKMLAEKKMEGYFTSRYRDERRIRHLILGFGPVTLPSKLLYHDDDGPTELRIRPLANLTNEEKMQSRLYYSKYVWHALCHLFRFKSWAPLIWAYFNGVSLGLQTEGGESVSGTQLLIARLLDRVNMSPYDFANLDLAGYMAAIMMLHGGYALSANALTLDNWFHDFPVQILHEFSPANAVEHYNGQVDLLSKSGWARSGGGLPIIACPFASMSVGAAPGIYPITATNDPDKYHQVQIPILEAGLNMQKDGSPLPSITAEYDRMFGWFHDPEAQGVSLDVRTILPWKLLVAPPAGSLYTPLEFWKLYFYTVRSTGLQMIEDASEFHPLKWFVGFDSILPGNGYPVSIDGDLTISVDTGRGGSRKSILLEWINSRPFSLNRSDITGK
jgi:hypothetical protein